ncbi:hypothetical protein THAOC_29072 [Thalassiosira oceanica]|uniref:Uncharacterized protein n=1 Tax=Thalassiosira oceanica TaxID=159749 RepID=K0RYN1_THAOC|nr:hypothetical protein THAOC_29072 [Thalassiosira oceanica]|eukprot:EJK51732.1 hypothetical protein THAOC_29072 [Thalassiosira oceanica]
MAGRAVFQLHCLASFLAAVCASFNFLDATHRGERAETEEPRGLTAAPLDEARRASRVCAARVLPPTVHRCPCGWDLTRISHGSHTEKEDRRNGNHGATGLRRQQQRLGLGRRGLGPRGGGARPGAVARPGEEEEEEALADQEKEGWQVCLRFIPVMALHLLHGVLVSFQCLSVLLFGCKTFHECPLDILN